VGETALALARKAAALFDERGFENGRLEAELLLAATIGLRRLDLYLQHDRPVDADELERFRRDVRRRLRHEPLQYIVGEAHFRQIVLRVDTRVLIPRPETEVLVGAVIDWATERPEGGRLSGLDIGTGSGAIAISLVREAPFERIVATDVMEGALEVAASNADAAGVGDRIDFRAGSLFEPVRDGERFDVIVSNPPYVAEAERAGLAPEVRDWEPASALFAAEEGLAVIGGIVAGARERLKAGGLLALEVGATQAAAVADRLRRTPGFDAPRIVRDLAGRERVVLVTADEDGGA
jgi:release factor glutamine methyltransferase